MLSFWYVVDHRFAVQAFDCLSWPGNLNVTILMSYAGGFSSISHEFWFLLCGDFNFYVIIPSCVVDFFSCSSLFAYVADFLPVRWTFSVKLEFILYGTYPSVSQTCEMIDKAQTTPYKYLGLALIYQILMRLRQRCLRIRAPWLYSVVAATILSTRQSDCFQSPVLRSILSFLFANPIDVAWDACWLPQGLAADFQETQEIPFQLCQPMFSASPTCIGEIGFFSWFLPLGQPPWWSQ